MEWCGCRPNGLRREIFGTMQRAAKTTERALCGTCAVAATGQRSMLREVLGNQ